MTKEAQTQAHGMTTLLEFRTTLTDEAWRRLEAREHQMSLGTGTVTHRDAIEDAIEFWLKQDKNLPYFRWNRVESARKRGSHPIDVKLGDAYSAWFRRNFDLQAHANGGSRKYHKNHLLNSLFIQTPPLQSATPQKPPSPKPPSKVKKKSRGGRTSARTA